MKYRQRTFYSAAQNPKIFAHTAQLKNFGEWGSAKMNFRPRHGVLEPHAAILSKFE